MSAEYSFVSVWRIPATADRVWRAMRQVFEEPATSTDARAGSRPHWWPGVSIQAAPGPLRAGSRCLVVVRSPLGYRLRAELEVTRIEGSAIEAASSGDLCGTGSVEIAAVGADSCRLVFRWDVRTEKVWMNASAWILRPAFARAHRRVMRAGERGLVAELTRV